jgi:hypothetical protein
VPWGGSALLRPTADEDVTNAKTPKSDRHGDGPAAIAGVGGWRCFTILFSYRERSGTKERMSSMIDLSIKRICADADTMVALRATFA